MSKSIIIQLLRTRLYPATVQNPATASTFRTLERFHLLSFESKCSAYEFYHSLSRETDNTGLYQTRVCFYDFILYAGSDNGIQDRYSEFLRMIRGWRHLKMLKRTGRGHDPGGVNTTIQGACAVLCPACPHPGKNLPSNWRDVPKNERYGLSCNSILNTHPHTLHSWKYALFIAMDANFRMRRKKVSSELKDPSLSRGFAYFVDNVPYISHLLEYASEKQEVRCLLFGIVLD